MLYVVCLAFGALEILLLAYVVFSFVPRPPEPILPIVRGVNRFWTPVLEPIRRRLPPLMMGGVGLDLSVLVVFLLLEIVKRLVGCG